MLIIVFDVYRVASGNYSDSTTTLLIASVIVFISLLVVFYLMTRKTVSFYTEAENQLRSARNTTDDALHSKTQFLTTMSNEIRTPLNHMLSTASLLLQTSLTDEQKKMLSNIHRGGVSLLSVINDSLDFFKIESGKLSLENNPFVLIDCIEETVSLLVSDSPHIRIHYTIDLQVPTLIVGDIIRIRQVLMNLFGNAIQFTDTGELLLHVGLVETHPDGIMQLQFKIADTGEKANIVTLKNLQENAVYTTHYSGLGLSIAARLIALMGGAIKIESTAAGSVFTFTIKSSKASEILYTQQAGTLTHGTIDRELSRKLPLRILAADDNEVSQMVLSSMLLKMGYSCEVALNGTEAVAKAIEQPYDLIFMDMFMPEMDGIEATRRIREYYLQSSKPVIIALTANALQEKENFLEAGINNFITKPYKPKELEQIIIESCSN